MSVSVMSFVTDSDSEWLNRLLYIPRGLLLSPSCNNSGRQRPLIKKILASPSCVACNPIKSGILKSVL